MRSVERHVLPELRQGRGRGPGVDAEPEIADVREALGRVNGHADRRVRALYRPRHHGNVLDLVEGAAIAESLPRPREANDLERLVEAGAILRQRHPEAVELARDRPAAHPELEPTAGKHVSGRRLLGGA